MPQVIKSPVIWSMYKMTKTLSETLTFLFKKINNLPEAAL